MAKSKQRLQASASQATGRRRKKPTSSKPTNPVERAFDGVEQLVSDTGEQLLSRSDPPDAATKPVSAQKAAAARTRSGQERQAATKKAGAARIQSGRQRQAAAKKAARARGAKTS